jgi:hypothetical protein
LINFVTWLFIPPTNLGRFVKSCKISPGLAFSGHTPIKKFSPIFNRLDSDIVDTTSSSMNPGSIVLSTITKEFGDKISESFVATLLSAEYSHPLE